MAPHKRRASDAGVPAQKKPCFMDDLMAAIELQNRLNFPTPEDKQRMQREYLDKLHADEVEIRNSAQSPLLRLPQEILDDVYTYVFDHEVLRVLMKDSKPCLAGGAHTGPLALASVCRKLHNDTATSKYAKPTFQLFTLKFVSLVETWRTPIDDDDIPGFLSFLRSLPASTTRFEVVGINGGRDGDHLKKKVMALNRVKITSMPTDEPHGHQSIREHIQTVFPRAEVRFRVVTTLKKV